MHRNKLVSSEKIWMEFAFEVFALAHASDKPLFAFELFFMCSIKSTVKSIPLLFIEIKWSAIARWKKFFTRLSKRSRKRYVCRSNFISFEATNHEEPFRSIFLRIHIKTWSQFERQIKLKLSFWHLHERLLIFVQLETQLKPFE